MADQTKVIPIRLTASEVLAIDALIESGRFDTRAGVIRAGLGTVFEKYKESRVLDRDIERERRLHPPRKGKNHWRQAQGKKIAKKFHAK